MCRHIPLCLASLVLCAVSLAPSIAAEPIRGLDPAVASAYVSAHGSFRCLDGSKTIPFSKVNDNYCDCLDGSDEPGTPACHNGMFYCANKGHEPALISSSFVDDGICDCCDGSDEPFGTCRNMCIEKGEAKKAALRQEIIEVEKALAEKMYKIQEARETKAKRAERILVIDAELAAQVLELEEAEVDKEKVQAEVDEKRRVAEVEHEAAEKEAAIREAEEAAARQAEEEETQRLAAEQGGAAEVQEEEVAPEVQEETGRAMNEQEETGHEETEQERGQRIASQWTRDPEAAGAAGDEAAGSADNEADATEYDGRYDPDATAYHSDYSNHYGDDGDDVGEDDEGDSDNDEPLPPPPHRYTPPRAKTFNHIGASELGQAMVKVTGAKNTLDRLTKEKLDLTNYMLGPVPLDFGPNDMFVALTTRCWSQYNTDSRTSTEVCFYGNATLNAHGLKTVVGKWAGWNEDYSVASWTDGKPCVEEPNTPCSTSVSMECGMYEKLEDSRYQDCEYLATMITPLACTTEAKEQAEAELALLEAAEALVIEQIRAEEEELRRSHPHLFHDEL